MRTPFPTTMLLTASALCALAGCATTADTSPAAGAPMSATQKQQQY